MSLQSLASLAGPESSWQYLSFLLALLRNRRAVVLLRNVVITMETAGSNGNRRWQTGAEAGAFNCVGIVARLTARLTGSATARARSRRRTRSLQHLDIRTMSALPVPFTHEQGPLFYRFGNRCLLTPAIKTDAYCRDISG